MTFKEENISHLDFKDESYIGIDGNSIMLRIFYTNKKIA